MERGPFDTVFNITKSCSSEVFNSIVILVFRFLFQTETFTRNRRLVTPIILVLSDKKSGKLALTEQSKVTAKPQGI